MKRPAYCTRKTRDCPNCYKSFPPNDCSGNPIAGIKGILEVDSVKKQANSDKNGEKGGCSAT